MCFFGCALGGWARVLLFAALFTVLGAGGVCACVSILMLYGSFFLFCVWCFASRFFCSLEPPLFDYALLGRCLRRQWPVLGPAGRFFWYVARPLRVAWRGGRGGRRFVGIVVFSPAGRIFFYI